MGWLIPSPQMNMAHAHKRVVQVEQTVTVPEDRVMLELTHEEAVKLRIYSYKLMSEPLGGLEQRKFFENLWRTIADDKLNTWDDKEFDRITGGGF